MLTGWLIYSQFEAKRNSFFANELITHAKEIGIDLQLLIREQITLKIEDKPTLYYNNKPLKNAKFALVRINDFCLSFQLEQMGILVFNDSQTSLICNDKYLTYCFANNLGIPTLDTFLIDKHTQNWQDINENLFPLIAKPLNLKGGEKVIFCKNKDYFIQNSHIFNDRFLLQKPATNLGEDIRIYVLNKKIIASVKRKSTTDFRSNFCLGGTASLIESNEQQIEIVNKITANLDAHYIGIDFLVSNGQTFLNEIEDVVGARMLYTLTDINPAKKLMQSIMEKL